MPPSYTGFDSVFSHNSEHVSKGFQELAEGLCNAPSFEPQFESLIETPVKVDYTNVTKNLSVFESMSNEPTLFNALLGRHGSVNKSKDKLNNNDDANVDDFRYQNITTETLGYTGCSVDVKPYGIAR